jgi:ATP-dependent DNA helicase 2 subunit 2
LTKIGALQPSTSTDGDREWVLYYTRADSERPIALDAVIVALNAQNTFLASKNSWTRKLVVVTDGENPIATAEYKSTIEAMNQNEVITSIVYVTFPWSVGHPLSLFSGVDFDDPGIGFQEENKSEVKVRCLRRIGFG